MECLLKVGHSVCKLTETVDYKTYLKKQQMIQVSDSTISAARGTER